MRFDLNGTLTSAISGPEDVAKPAADLAKSPEAVKVLKDKFDFLEKLPVPAAGELLKGVLGEGGGGKEKPAPSDLGKAARGLLKGLTGQ